MTWLVPLLWYLLGAAAVFYLYVIVQVLERIADEIRRLGTVFCWLHRDEFEEGPDPPKNDIPAGRRRDP